MSSFVFFFYDTSPTEIYTLSLHDALPIFGSSIRSSAVSTWTTCAASRCAGGSSARKYSCAASTRSGTRRWNTFRSEEHTSELQSHSDLVCRLLLEKKKIKHKR